MANKLIAFALVVLAILAGIFILDKAGIIDIDPGPAPHAESVFQVQFLATSDTDRSENMETISTNGATITYLMMDNDMDGLGDVALDVRVTNANVGPADDTWAFAGSVKDVGFTQVAGGVHQPLLNYTDLNSRWAVTYSLTDAGAPTLSQSGDTSESRDWKTGASDQLNIDLAMNPEATNDVAAASQVSITFTVGGVELTLWLLEQ